MENVGIRKGPACEQNPLLQKLIDGVDTDYSLKINSFSIKCHRWLKTLQTSVIHKSQQ